MDRADVLASLSGAQRELDAHLNNARTTLMSLPHTTSDLTPMKTRLSSHTCTLSALVTTALPTDHLDVMTGVRRRVMATGPHCI